MAIGKALDKVEDFLLRYKMILFVISALILILAYLGKIPPTLQIETQSVLGGFGFAGLSIAAILFLVAVSMISMFSDETEFAHPTVFLIPVFLIIAAVLLTVGGVGALLSDLFTFMKSIPGIILTVITFLFVLRRFKFL